MGQIFAAAERLTAIAHAPDYPATKVTGLLTLEICSILLSINCRVKRECPVGLSRTVQSGRVYQGHLDLFARFDDGSSVAIEIDRGNKLWSLRKLEYVAGESGSTALWVRWHGRVSMPTGSCVTVLNLARNGAPAHLRNAQGQAE